MHIKTLNLSAEQKADPSVLLRKFVDWTRPKSNALAAAANFRRLEKGALSLSEYIDKATVLCDQCEYIPEARDRLLRDAIVMELRSKKVYHKCVEKGSALTLEETITIAQNQNATAHQVGYMRPEFKSAPVQREIHKLQTESGHRTLGAKKGKRQPQKWVSVDKQRKSKRESCFNCGAKPSHTRIEVSVLRNKRNTSNAAKKVIMPPYTNPRLKTLV